jgi:hypothetical protein
MYLGKIKAMKSFIHVALFLALSALSSIFAQNFPITPDWEVTRSVDKMTDKSVCHLASPIGYAENDGKGIIVKLAIQDDQLHLVTTSSLSLAYRNVQLRIDKNAALSFTLGQGNKIIKLESARNFPILIQQLKTGKNILLRLALTADHIIDLNISAIAFNDGYVAYKKCRAQK